MGTTEDEQPINRADILRGYEVEPQQFVVFDREEFERPAAEDFPEHGDRPVCSAV